MISMLIYSATFAHAKTRRVRCTPALYYCLQKEEML